MKRAVKLAGLAAALSIGAASEARADVLVNGNFCGGNEFSTCAFINSSTSTVGGVTVLTLTVTNPTTNPSGSIFTATAAQKQKTPEKDQWRSTLSKKSKN